MPVSNKTPRLVFILFPINSAYIFETFVLFINMTIVPNITKKIITFILLPERLSCNVETRKKHEFIKSKLQHIKEPIKLPTISET